LPRPLIVAVTVLTSVAAAQPQQMQQRVLDLARNALTAQCDGLVSSALEASLLREQFGSQPILVCPGIRPSSHNTHDQRRTCTPAQAIQQGADYLVVGRPITEAQNPRQAAQQMLQEMEARGTAC
jgi:orotidine-5'-phosphate decarboxylase